MVSLLTVNVGGVNYSGYIQLHQSLMPVTVAMARVLVNGGNACKYIELKLKLSVITFCLSSMLIKLPINIFIILLI